MRVFDYGGQNNGCLRVTKVVLRALRAKNISSICLAIARDSKLAVNVFLPAEGFDLAPKCCPKSDRGFIE